MVAVQGASLLSDELIATVVVLLCLSAIFVVWRCRDRVRVGEAMREAFQSAASTVVQVSGMTSIGTQLEKTTEAFKDMRGEMKAIAEAIGRVNDTLKKQAGG